MDTGIKREQGASLLEYAILVALISIVAIGTIQQTGNNTADKLCETSGYMAHSSQKISYSAAQSCCGFTMPGAGGGFVCL